jgi:hypothetical protein
VTDAAADTDPLTTAYRHDVHKLRGRSHGSAVDKLNGVRVNESVPLGADGDAALLSRPSGEPAETVAAYQSPTRLSLLTGSPVTAPDEGLPTVEAIDPLVAATDPETLHRAWVSSSVASEVNESVFHPYTSLKYHTLLVAALLDNYRAGFEFEELFLAVPPAGAAVPAHRTVLNVGSIRLVVTGVPGEWPAASLGASPARSFADVYARLPACPFDTGRGRAWRVLDAQVRRIRSWSTALQFLEDYVDECPVAGVQGGGVR